MKVIAPEDVMVLDGTEWMNIFERTLTLSEDLVAKMKVAIYTYM